MGWNESIIVFSFRDCFADYYCFFYLFLLVIQKAKQERRKRRKDEDDIEAALLEANPLPEKSNNLRFQADSLHEICLIFFRFISFFLHIAMLYLIIFKIMKDYSISIISLYFVSLFFIAFQEYVTLRDFFSHFYPKFCPFLNYFLFHLFYFILSYLFSE